MKHVLVVAIVAGAVLASGCAGVPMPADALRGDAAPMVVLDPDAKGRWSKALAKSLRRAIKAQGGEVSARDDGSVLALLNAEQVFEPGSAQLRASALEACNAMASGFLQFGGGVLHLSVAGGEDADLEPPIRLAARRASSLEAVLQDAGVPGRRLRSGGGAPAAGESAAVRMVIRPVVRGTEAAAWLSPQETP